MSFVLPVEAYPCIPQEWKDLWQKMNDFPFFWIPTTENMYHDQLGSVPPAAQSSNCFLAGEPHHSNDQYENVYACFVHTKLGYFAKYLSLKEYREFMTRPVQEEFKNLLVYNSPQSNMVFVQREVPFAIIVNGKSEPLCHVFVTREGKFYVDFLGLMDQKDVSQFTYETYEELVKNVKQFRMMAMRASTLMDIVKFI